MVSKDGKDSRFTPRSDADEPEDGLMAELEALLDQLPGEPKSGTPAATPNSKEEPPAAGEETPVVSPRGLELQPLGPADDPPVTDDEAFDPPLDPLPPSLVPLVPAHQSPDVDLIPEADDSPFESLLLSGEASAEEPTPPQQDLAGYEPSPAGEQAPPVGQVLAPHDSSPPDFVLPQPEEAAPEQSPRFSLPPRTDAPEPRAGLPLAVRQRLSAKDKELKRVRVAYEQLKSENERFRKRIENLQRRRLEQSKTDFIARFVEVLDNLDRAIESIENNFDSDSVLQGIILVRSRLVQLLREEGLEKIFVGGQPFDPTHSEAVGVEEVEDPAMNNIVVREIQRGYYLKGSLLRPSQVIVGRSDPSPNQAEPHQESELPEETSPEPADTGQERQGDPFRWTELMDDEGD